jgi:hypothetical protein
MSTSIKQLPLSRAVKNALSVDYVPIDQLKPDPKNARVHSKKQIRQIAKSIESFGFNVPILIDSNFEVIAGHGRVLAAKHLGLTEVPRPSHRRLCSRIPTAEIRRHRGTLARRAAGRRGPDCDPRSGVRDQQL